MRLLRRLLLAAAVGLGLLVAAVYVGHRRADGPLGPISGGPLRAGALVTDPNVDWAAVLDARKPGAGVELELVATGESRTTGAFVHDGQLYVPCDLGFLGRRSPSAVQRAIGGLIASVKHWHHDAERDGRVVLRIDDRRYERQAVRVTDPELLAALRAETQERASRFFGRPLLDVPADPDPESIWFFRMDPRASG